MSRVFAPAGVTAAFGRFVEGGIGTPVGTYNMDLWAKLNACGGDLQSCTTFLTPGARTTALFVTMPSPRCFRLVSRMDV